MYKYVLNSVVKISMMFAKYFEYYTIILRWAVFFVDTLYMTIRCAPKKVQLLQQETPELILLNLWPTNRPDYKFSRPLPRPLSGRGYHALTWRSHGHSLAA